VRGCAAVLACAMALAGWPAAATAAAAAPARPGDVSARAREQARDVLAQRRFQPTGLPSPLRGPRERIGAALRSLGGPFEDAFRSVAGLLPGGRPVLWALLAAALVGAAAAVAARAGARRVRAGGTASASAGGAGDRPSAARLRDEADRAEARGDLDAALRLRFRAGLVELDTRALIELRPGLTNDELLRAVPSPTLAGLVDGFEAVAYGGRPAQDGDLRSAREGWPRVVAEAGRR
jgi:hypothetical protein